jgi:hypothetical protein
MNAPIQLPPPRDWQAFQDVCLEVHKVIWDNPLAQKNGRGGQGQHGVDVFGRPRNHDKHHGVECKGHVDYEDQSLSESDLKAAIQKAEAFRPRLEHFTLASLTRRDARIQETAREISESRVSRGLFSVSVMSWDDLSETTQANLGLRRFYRHFMGPDIDSIPLPVQESKFSCRPCEGTGRRWPALQDSEVCHICKGKGFFFVLLDGQEVLDCPRCKGTGKHWVPLPGAGPKDLCVVCDGMGRIVPKGKIRFA